MRTGDFVDIYSLAKMLADTVETLETHYASPIPAGGML
jgi:hypothetical protein